MAEASGGGECAGEGSSGCKVVVWERARECGEQSRLVMGR